MITARLVARTVAGSGLLPEQPAAGGGAFTSGWCEAPLLLGVKFFRIF